MIMYLRDITVCFAAALFYGLLMFVKLKPAIPAAITAAVAYLAYRIIYIEAGHELAGYFVAAIIVAAGGEILARVMKMPATIFVMTGIIPLVPGVGLYRTMLCLVRSDISGFLEAGTKTLFISGVIAVAVAVVNSIARHIFTQKKIKQ